MDNQTDIIDANTSLTRRNIIQGAVAGAAALAAGNAVAGDHSHHNHHAHHGSATTNTGLIDAALTCGKESDLCLDHCLEMFKQGDTTLAKCADVVNEMSVMCAALAKLGSFQSEELPALAKICISVAKRCKSECEKHAKHHSQCKTCAESCDLCIEECKKIV